MIDVGQHVHQTISHNAQNISIILSERSKNEKVRSWGGGEAYCVFYVDDEPIPRSFDDFLDTHLQQLQKGECKINCFACLEPADN